jgi:excisionase family DNA binding protein
VRGVLIPDALTPVIAKLVRAGLRVSIAQDGYRPHPATIAWLDDLTEAARDQAMSAGGQRDAYSADIGGESSVREIDTETVAGLLGVNERTVRRYAVDGALKGRQVFAGGPWIFRRSDVDGFIRTR